MTQSQDILLSARGINKRFGAVVAAEDINIDVPRGQRLSLIGSNGAGKTTFVNMVTGYLKPDSGRISLVGEDITALGPRQITKKGVSRSFQIPQLALEMNVLDNMLVAQACGEGRLSFWEPAYSRQRVDAAMYLLERFMLQDHARKKVAELPGGLRKLLDIAMALTGEPKLLLLDEPTSGVSVAEKYPMMDTISEALNSTDVTVLFVEHDMDIVLRYAERIVAFYSGSVLADGKPTDVLADDRVKQHVTGHFAAAGSESC